ncbi:hypothetical protein BX666DRAFT_1945160 [Dichotomocladium elegans]|nr:hypothetical protein BX666DRAFT_1945160 [Dichotomocladium elegans]
MNHDPTYVSSSSSLATIAPKGNDTAVYSNYTTVPTTALGPVTITIIVFLVLITCSILQCSRVRHTMRSRRMKLTRPASFVTSNDSNSNIITTDEGSSSWSSSSSTLNGIEERRQQQQQQQQHYDEKEYQFSPVVTPPPPALMVQHPPSEPIIANTDAPLPPTPSTFPASPV